MSIYFAQFPGWHNVDLSGVFLDNLMNSDKNGVFFGQFGYFCRKKRYIGRHKNTDATAYSRRERI